MKNEKRVFAVHKWETVDEKHRVHVWEDGKEEHKNFDTWEEAEEFAANKAKELGLHEFQIDTPWLSHIFIPTGIRIIINKFEEEINEMHQLILPNIFEERKQIEK